MTDRQKISADLVRAHSALDALARLGRDLGSVASEAEACKRIVADAQDVVRRFAFDESAIRADERASVGAEVDSLRRLARMVVAYADGTLNTKDPLGVLADAARAALSTEPKR